MYYYSYSMGKLGIYTKNPRFYYGVIRALKDFGINFISIENIFEDLKNVDVVLSSTGDSRISEKQIFQEDPVRAVRRSFSFFMGKDKFHTIYIGIDPGPKPGIAVTSNNVVLEAFELFDVGQIRNTVETLIGDYGAEYCSIRVGNGDKPNRQYILRQILPLGLNVEIINETGTSYPHKTHDNALSAARIANIEIFQKNGPSVTAKKRRELIEEEFRTLNNI